jgi:hypothetical protein
MEINYYLGDKFRTISCIKSGALLEELIHKPIVALMNLK